MLVSYGVLAISLDAAREDRGHALPDPIATEDDQYFGLVYMLRCAPAHDISEPQWDIRGRFRRIFTVRAVTVDLTNLDGQAFDFAHIGGVGAVHQLIDYGRDRGFC